MHDQQLDPTIIVLIPYPLQRLCIYVIANVVATICIQSSTRLMIQTLLNIIQLSFFIMILFVVCGASPYHNLYHTFLASVYFVTCTLFQYPLILVDAATTAFTGNAIGNENGSSDDSTNQDTDTSEKSPSTKIQHHKHGTINHKYVIWIPELLDTIQQQLRGRSVGIAGTCAAISSSSSQYQQRIIVLHQSIVYCCTIVTVLFQVLLLYDRGYQIQRYPIPIVLGCTIGWIIGTCVGTIRAILR